MPQKPQIESRSAWSQVFVLKLWIPIILGSVVALSFDGDRTPLGHILITVPLTLALAFLATLAVVRVNGEEIEYLRFWRWNKIASHEIVRARQVFSSIGSLTLIRSVAPWRRIYFVLDTGQRKYLLSSPRYGLLDRLATHHDSSGPSIPDQAKLSPLHHFEVAILYLTGLLIGSWQSTVPRPSSTETIVILERMPGGLNVLWTGDGLLSSDYMPLLCIIATVMLALRYRSQARWVFACIAGLSTPALIVAWHGGVPLVR